MPDSQFYINKAGPVHASSYISTDQVLISSGAGPSKTGQKNRIAAYSISQSLASATKPEERQGIVTGEVLLSDEEDAASSFAVNKDLILAGANESLKSRQSSGDNHHLRTFRLALSTSETSDSCTIKRSLEHQIWSDLSIDLDDYQKITKISEDGKYAGLVSNEGLFAIVDLSNMRKLPLDGYDASESGKILDLEFHKEGVWLLTAQDVIAVSLPGGEEMSIVYSLSQSGAPKDFALCKVVILSADSVLLGMNHKSMGYGFISIFKLYKGSLLQRFAAHARSKVRGVQINTRRPGPDTPQLISMTTADGQLTLFDANLELRKTWKRLHAFPISATSFRADSKQMITCSIDERVNVLDLTDLRPPTSKTFLAFLLTLFLLLLYVAYAFQTGEWERWMRNLDYWLARQHRKLAEY